MSFSVSIDSCCKINLRLKVTGKLENGYHTLDTVFVPVSFPADRISVQEKDEEGVSFFSEAFPEGGSENNLAVKAALAYAGAAGIVPHWHIVLDKQVPIAAGLGGGSADAAAVLEVLNGHYRLFDAEKLAAMALALGADVPFFLNRRPMRATGVGEVLEDFELPENMPEILLVFPGFPISAKWAYQNLDKKNIFPDSGVTSADYRRAFAEPEKADWDELVRNDLAFAVWEKFPLAAALRENLLKYGAWCAQISGSGSSLFALFPDKKCAAAAAETLRNSIYGNQFTRIFTGGKEW